MYNTSIFIDRFVSDADLANGFGQAIGVSVKHVAVMNQEDFKLLGSTWAQPTVGVVLRASGFRGDFPMAIELLLREDTPDFRQILSRAARLLGASILTDELVVNPLDDSRWLTFTPDGEAVVIETEDEEFAVDEPAILMTPESRQVYEAHRRRAEQLATTASS